MLQQVMTSQSVHTSITRLLRSSGLVKRIEIRNFNSPLSTIFPKRFFPRRKFLVEQFHRRFRNWCWHSEMARLAPLTRADRTPGFSRTNLRCFRRSVVWMAGSMYMMPDVSGEMLFGSPTLAMPLKVKIVVFRWDLWHSFCSWKFIDRKKSGMHACLPPFGLGVGQQILEMDLAFRFPVWAIVHAIVHLVRQSRRCAFRNAEQR